LLEEDRTMKHVAILVACVLLVLVSGCGLVGSDDGNDDSSGGDPPPQSYLDAALATPRFA
jgi:hypothetical protein